jgi:hypothetical protein
VRKFAGAEEGWCEHPEALGAFLDAVVDVGEITQIDI